MLIVDKIPQKFDNSCCQSCYSKHFNLKTENERLAIWNDKRIIVHLSGTSSDGGLFGNKGTTSFGTGLGTGSTFGSTLGSTFGTGTTGGSLFGNTNKSTGFGSTFGNTGILAICTELSISVWFQLKIIYTPSSPDDEHVTYNVQNSTTWTLFVVQQKIVVATLFVMLVYSAEWFLLTKQKREIFLLTAVALDYVYYSFNLNVLSEAMFNSKW